MSRVVDALEWMASRKSNLSLTVEKEGLFTVELSTFESGSYSAFSRCFYLNSGKQVLGRKMSRIIVDLVNELQVSIGKKHAEGYPSICEEESSQEKIH